MSVGGKRVFGSAESCSRRDWAFPAIGDWWAISITEVSARRAGMPANGHCMESCRSVLSVGRICIADLVFWFLAPHELRNGRWLYSANGGYNACPDESERTEASRLVRNCQLMNGQKKRKRQASHRSENYAVHNQGEMLFCAAAAPSGHGRTPSRRDWTVPTCTNREQILRSRSLQ